MGKKCFPCRRKVIPIKDAREKKVNEDKNACVSWCRTMKMNIFLQSVTLEISFNSYFCRCL